MNDTAYVLAVDPGGSKCEALLVRRDGTALRFRRVARPGISGRSPAIVRATIRPLLRGRRPREVLYASVGKYYPWRGPVRPLVEADAALALAGVKTGVVAIAGTGARITAYLNDGRRVTLDGLGPVLGDRGGGHQIGRQALRAAVRALQHPRHATRLAQMIPRALGLRPPTIPRLIQFSLLPHDRSVLAALAAVVDEAARAGDAVAVRLLKQAAGDLADTVRDLVEMTGLARQSYRLIGVGSVVAKSDIYWREFCRRTRRFAPRLEPCRPTLPPVVGVALCGLPAASAPRLLATVPEVLSP